jgi:3-isopropylmalate dehydrogenase
MKVVCLPGDGIGPEVMEAAMRVLEPLPLELESHPFGGEAIAKLGLPLPAPTLEACKQAQAVLLGAIGKPEYDGATVRPEQGLIELRRALDVYANLRPSSDGDKVDLLIVRELVGGIYYGRRGRTEDGVVFDTCEYTEPQIERIARRGFELARRRRKKLTAVDKANILATSRLWRSVIERIKPDYLDVELEYMLVDNAAMQIARAPEQFDVIVTENMFGDILSDLAAAITGGLGLAASASLADDGPGIFEPVHGSAPDIAGQGIANPTAMLRSVAMMLEHAFDEEIAARELRQAVETAIRDTPTPDLGGTATTREFTDTVVEALSSEA